MEFASSENTPVYAMVRKQTGVSPSFDVYLQKKKTEYYEEEIERVVVEHGAKLLPGKKDINVTLLFFTGYLYKIGENLFFIYINN